MENNFVYFSGDDNDDSSCHEYQHHYHCDEPILKLYLILKSIKLNLKEIEQYLSNPQFGLPEIKTEVFAIGNEVSRIEAKLDSPTFGLADIKTEVFGMITSPTFGLIDIKKEISAIAGSVGTGTGAEVARIEAKLDSPTFGLAEIKTEIFALERVVLSPTLGLAEVKSEIAAIEREVLSPTFGLAEIKTEVFAIGNEAIRIEAKLDSPTFGLAEIKTEIQQILLLLGGAVGENRSSGPFFATNDYLEVKLLNNCPSFVGPVTVTAFNLATCPKSTLVVAGTPITTTIFLPPECTSDVFFFENAAGQSLDISGDEIEVQVKSPGGLPSCVLLYSRTTNADKAATANEINSCCYVGTT